MNASFPRRFLILVLLPNLEIIILSDQLAKDHDINASQNVYPVPQTSHKHFPREHMILIQTEKSTSDSVEWDDATTFIAVIVDYFY